MAQETPVPKLCPLLRQPCLRQGCQLWLQVTLSGRDKEGKKVASTPPEQCSLVWAGLAGVRGMAGAG